MSYPPNGPPPPYYGFGVPPPHHPPAPGAFTYVPVPVPAPMMMPVYPPPPPQQPSSLSGAQRPYEPYPPQPTVVTNYIYHEPPQPQPIPQLPALPEPVKIQDPLNWVATSGDRAAALTHQAFVGGKEGWDGSPLWVIRSHHSGELVPGKLAIKHRQGYIPHGGKEIPVHNFEVLCCPPHTVRWVPASNGDVPAGAIPAGNTHRGEPLYIARAPYKKSITPGKVHHSHGCAYISFGGNEVAFKNYEVLVLN